MSVKTAILRTEYQEILCKFDIYNPNSHPLLNKSHEYSQPSKFRTSNWVEINDNIRKAYGTKSQIKLKTTILIMRFCNY